MVPEVTHIAGCLLKRRILNEEARYGGSPFHLIQVLEINTSSKRNGKRILSELQEATQSHQVRAGSELASDGLGPSFKRQPAKSRKVKSSRYSRNEVK
jgi:hypothetical protein